MAEDGVYATLTQIFRDVFLRDDLELAPELTAKDVEGWNSFKQIEILIAVEEHYQFTFSTQEVDKLANVGDLARTIAAKTAKT